MPSSPKEGSEIACHVTVMPSDCLGPRVLGRDTLCLNVDHRVISIL
jgi:hypothetical protein